jgi:hypothetical protein
MVWITPAIIKLGQPNDAPVPVEALGGEGGGGDIPQLKVNRLLRLLPLIRPPVRMLS